MSSIYFVRKGGDNMPTPSTPSKHQLLQGNPAKKNVEELKKRVEQEERMNMSAENIIPPS
jgi:hypothetical protein